MCTVGVVAWPGQMYEGIASHAKYRGGWVADSTNDLAGTLTDERLATL